MKSYKLVDLLYDNSFGVWLNENCLKWFKYKWD